MKRKQVASFVDSVLKGIGQIMLQGNSLTGALFLLGLFLGSVSYGGAALLATLLATLTAKCLHFDSKLISEGIYGFNAALVGVALVFIFGDQWPIWLLVVVIGGILTPLLHHLFILKKWPVYTFPFILMTWLTYFTLTRFLSIEVPLSPLPDADSMSFLERQVQLIYGGFGQVIFQNTLLIGILFFVGLLLANPVAAFYALIASYLGGNIAMWFHFDVSTASFGLFGFNAVLTAIALSGRKRADGGWVFLGVLVTVLIQFLLVQSNILQPLGGIFTFAFVSGTWTILLLKKLLHSLRPPSLGGLQIDP